MVSDSDLRGENKQYPSLTKIYTSIQNIIHLSYPWIYRIHGQFAGYSKRPTQWHKELFLNVGYLQYLKLRNLISSTKVHTPLHSPQKTSLTITSHSIFHRISPSTKRLTNHLLSPFQTGTYLTASCSHLPTNQNHPSVQLMSLRCSSTSLPLPSQGTLAKLLRALSSVVGHSIISTPSRYHHHMMHKLVLLGFLLVWLMSGSQVCHGILPLVLVRFLLLIPQTSAILSHIGQ